MKWGGGNGLGQAAVFNLILIVRGVLIMKWGWVGGGGLGKGVDCELDPKF